MGGVCNAVRSIRMGGYEATNAGARRAHIEFVPTATLGNMTDFGNLTQGRRQLKGCSNGHGGVG